MRTTTTPAATEPLWFVHNLARVLVDGSCGDGTLGLVEMTGRRGDMPPLHLHEREDEAFYVLEGTMTVHLPGEVVELRAGEAALAPRRVPHAYRVESETARWLAIATPAGFEQFVRDVADPAEAETLPPADREVDGGALAEAGARYGIRIIGPPGATL